MANGIAEQKLYFVIEQNALSRRVSGLNMTDHQNNGWKCGPDNRTLK